MSFVWSVFRNDIGNVLLNLKTKFMSYAFVVRYHGHRFGEINHVESHQVVNVYSS